MSTLCARAELHTNDRLLLEAVREVKARSDKLQVQDFNTELWELHWDEKWSIDLDSSYHW